jgi:hypothetical protein
MKSPQNTAPPPPAVPMPDYEKSAMVQMLWESQSREIQLRGALARTQADNAGLTAEIAALTTPDPAV